MKLVIHDSAACRPLPFYLAMEEYFARPEFEDDYFFMWQVDPTVIIGRNQLLEAEIDTGFCNRQGIRVFRRKSGGGAVFADRNNIMFSLITSSGSGVASVFGDYTSRVAAILRKLGLDASDNARNDVLVGGRKISGNAFYHVGSRSIVHGTMLFDTDRALMAGALTPSAGKLESKGVKSVGSRITTIREHLPLMSIDDFKTFVAAEMSDGDPYKLSGREIAEIERLALPYFDNDHLRGKNPAGTLSNSMRIDGAGEFRVVVTVAHGRIRDISLTGDFFTLSDSALTDVADRLKGVDYNREAIRNALSDVDVARSILNLTNEKLIDLIWKN